MKQVGTYAHAVMSYGLQFTSLESFYELVRWLNENVGYGRDNWTMDGKVVKHLRKGRPVRVTLYIINPVCDNPEFKVNLDLIVLTL